MGNKKMKKIIKKNTVDHEVMVNTPIVLQDFPSRRSSLEEEEELNFSASDDQDLDNEQEPQHLTIHGDAYTCKPPISDKERKQMEKSQKIQKQMEEKERKQKEKEEKKKEEKEKKLKAKEDKELEKINKRKLKEEMELQKQADKANKVKGLLELAKQKNLEQKQKEAFEQQSGISMKFEDVAEGHQITADDVLTTNGRENHNIITLNTDKERKMKEKLEREKLEKEQKDKEEKERKLKEEQDKDEKQKKLKEKIENEEKEKNSKENKKEFNLTAKPFGKHVKEDYEKNHSKALETVFLQQQENEKDNKKNTVDHEVMVNTPIVLQDFPSRRSSLEEEEELNFSAS